MYPPRTRGLPLGLFNTGPALSNVSPAAVSDGSAQLAPNSDWQWKTPIICQIPLNLALGLGTLLLHESPRWLLIKGKED